MDELICYKSNALIQSMRMPTNTYKKGQKLVVHIMFINTETMGQPTEIQARSSSI